MTAAVLTPPAGARRLAGLQALAMALLVAAVSIPLSASEAVGAGWPAKLALVGRMAVLVAVAWWMLRPPVAAGPTSACGSRGAGGLWPWLWCWATSPWAPGPAPCTRRCCRRWASRRPTCRPSPG